MEFKSPPTHVKEQPVETAVPTAPPRFKRRQRTNAVTAVAKPREPKTAVWRPLWMQAQRLWQRVDKLHTLALGLGAGLFLGLVVLGWWLWPVQWVDAGFNELAAGEQALVLEMTADLYSYELDPVRVAQVMHDWQDGETILCAMVASEDDVWARMRLTAIAAVRNGEGCQ